VVVLLWLPRLATAHEPVFSLGPETIYQNGFGIEGEFETQRGSGSHELAMNYELIYGLLENLSLSLNIPHVLESEGGGGSSTGIGDVVFRGKYRFFKRDRLGTQDKISAILGVKFPTGNQNDNPAIGTGTTDVLMGVSYGHESRRWYYFATFRYLLRTEDGGFAPGDILFYDAAAGVRPWKRGYLEWDLVLLLELSGERDFKGSRGGTSLANTGGHTIWLGPTALLSYRNIMFKGGIQFTPLQQLNGSQTKQTFRSVLAAEYHF